MRLDLHLTGNLLNYKKKVSIRRRVGRCSLRMSGLLKANPVVKANHMVCGRYGMMLFCSDELRAATSAAAAAAAGPTPLFVCAVVK